MKPNGYPAAAEASKINTEQIANTFRDSQREINRMTADEDFQGLCESRGIDPFDDMATEQYWDAFADYVNPRITEMRKSDNPDHLSIDTLELLANTPQLLHKHTNLLAEGRKDNAERRIACTFNALIGDYAGKYPQVAVSTVHRGLDNMAAAAIEDPAIASRASMFIRERLRGVQHESAFGQALAHTGRGYRKSTITEDLHGFDYLAEGLGKDPLRLDVKSGTTAMDGQQYQIRGNTIKILSPFQDREFHDRFFVDDAKAAARGPALDAMLSHIEMQMQVAKTAAAAAIQHS